MEIDKQTWRSLVGMLKSSTASTELELLFKHPITTTTFSELLQYYMSLEGVTFVNHPESLDVSYNDYRATLTGTEGIKSYCKNNQVPRDCQVELIQKVRLMPPVDIAQYALRVQAKEEIPVTEEVQISNFMLTLADQPKYFRFKKRYSFTTRDQLFRIDCTLVRSAAREAPTFIQSGTMTQPPRYEVEIEYLGDRALLKQAKPVDTILKGLFAVAHEVLLVISNSTEVMKRDDKAQVLSSYMKLIDKENADVREGFIGPKPVTLELKNLLNAAEDVLSIKKGYCVTDKSDGERHLIYVDAHGALYALTSRMTIKKLSVQSSGDTLKNCVFDAEMVRFKGDAEDRVLMFDVYVWKGKDVRDLPFMVKKEANETQTRYGLVKQGVALLAHASVLAKTFYAGGDDDDKIFKQCEALLTKIAIGNMPYKTDGLVFQPMQEPVPKTKGAWKSVFKWKPPEENSIDFLVTLERDLVLYDDVTNRQMRKLKLMVGMDTSRATIKPLDMLAQQGRGDRAVARKYVPVLFTPEGSSTDFSYSTVAVSDDDQELHCENGDVIRDSTIVEFYFKDSQWTPMRVRKDKTELYQSTGSISGTANDHMTALNVWKSIQMPVTEQHLTGAIVLDDTMRDAVIGNTLYYDRNVSRDTLSMRPMMDFHNQWVKDRTLLKTFRGHARSLLDLGCGKGGDMHKWKHAGFTTVLGIDLYEDNLTNPLDGAYARLRQSNLNPATHTYVFTQMDVSQPIDGRRIEATSNDDFRTLSKILWSIQPAPSSVLRKYEGLATSGFDVVSCQFAVHYFFKTAETLKTFASNVAKHLVPGGYFVGTCLDGFHVHQSFKGIAKGEPVKGVKDDHTVWAIWKDYDGPWDAPKKNLGKQVTVYIETINKRIPEYLVDYDLLTMAMAEHDIHPLSAQEAQHLGLPNAASTGMFDTLFRNLEAQPRNTLHPALANALTMSDVEKAYSFMNRWFVFRKSTPAKRA